MRNMLMVGAASVALLGATQAMAQSAQMSGFVQPVCEVVGLDTALAFASMTAGQEVNDDDINIACNDGDGATLVLRSSEGGMESDDNEDLSIEYTAELTSAGIPELPLSLTTSPGAGVNDEFVSVDVLGSPALAIGGVTAALKVTLNDTAAFAGGYSDTISVEITAL